jgi:hypothetical protein
MYKSTSRFRQALARKGKKVTSRNLVASDSAPSKKSIRTRLHERLDKGVRERLAADRERYEASERKPQLVKKPPSN